MYRISTNLPNDNMQFYARTREYELNQIQNRIASQSRIQNLRDDPVSAAHATRHQSYLARLERYAENIEYAQTNYRVTEGYMREGVDILQRIREIGVQGANGTYSAEDRAYMANEVDQLLNELAEIANARNAEGRTIFSGSESRSQPFRIIRGNVEGVDGQRITNVQYTGDIGERNAEVMDGSTVPLNIPGNQVFWAENQQVYSSVNASAYQVPEDTSIFVDGVEVELNAGDNIYAVMSKINDSDAAVEARLDPVRDSLVLQTTAPHQLWLSDGQDGRVLRDLGVLVDREGGPPNNIAPSADVFGGSVFDMVISLRDNLYANDTIDTGGSALKGIDSALDNMLAKVGEIGARDTRLGFTLRRTEREMPEVTDHLSQEVDVDMTEALTELRMMEYTHQAAIGTAGRVLQTTLLNFLR